MPWPPQRLSALPARVERGDFSALAWAELASWAAGLSAGWAVWQFASGVVWPVEAALVVGSGVAVFLAYRFVAQDWRLVVAAAAYVLPIASSLDTWTAVVAGAGFCLSAASSGGPSVGLSEAGRRCLVAVPVVTVTGCVALASRLLGFDADRVGLLVAAAIVGAAVLWSLRREETPVTWMVAAALPTPLLALPVSASCVWSAYLVSGLSVALGFLVVLPASSVLAGSFVRRAIAQEITVATSLASDEMYDQLHQVVLNRLAVAESMLRRGESEELLGELRRIEVAVRHFRATAVSRPDQRVSEVLSAVARSYRSAVELRIEATPADLSVEVDVESAVQLYRLLDEFLSNAAKHAPAGAGGKAAVSVTAKRSDDLVRLQVSGEGTSLSELGNGTLARLVTGTNARENWTVRHRRDMSGAAFDIGFVVGGGIS